MTYEVSSVPTEFSTNNVLQMHAERSEGSRILFHVQIRTLRADDNGQGLGVTIPTAYPQPFWPEEVAEILGITPGFLFAGVTGGAGSVSLLGQMSAAITSGMINLALCIGAIAPFSEHHGGGLQRELGHLPAGVAPQDRLLERWQAVRVCRVDRGMSLERLRHKNVQGLTLRVQRFNSFRNLNLEL
jgi:hypothetical protein